MSGASLNTVNGKQTGRSPFMITLSRYLPEETDRTLVRVRKRSHLSNQTIP